MLSYQPSIKQRYLQYFLRRKSSEGFKKAPFFRSARALCTTLHSPSARPCQKSIWHIYRHICLTNLQKIHQTSLLTPLDTSTPPLTPFDPLAHLYCLTNQRTYQMSPLTPWDPLEVCLDPLKPPRHLPWHLEFPMHSHRSPFWPPNQAR